MAFCNFAIPARYKITNRPKSMNPIIKKARLFRSLYETLKDELDIPHFSCFPENSCEVASLFLGYYLSLHFPEKTIELIRGVDDANGCPEYHFWLEIDGLIYDLTIDQFQGYDKPIYAYDIHPMSDKFIEEMRKTPTLYQDYYFNQVLESERFIKSLSLLAVAASQKNG